MSDLKHLALESNTELAWQGLGRALQARLDPESWRLGYQAGLRAMLRALAGPEKESPRG